MKDTLIIQTLKLWDRLSKKDRIRLLQQLEHENSEIQGRFERKLITTDMLKGNIGGLFNCLDPDYIYLPNQMSTDSLSYVNSTIHEGYHAYIWDYVSGKTNLTLYGRVDKARLHMETMYRAYLHILCNDNCGPYVYDYSNVEEDTVKKETAINLIYNLVKSCESKNDLNYIIEPFFRTMADVSLFKFRKSQQDISGEFEKWILIGKQLKMDLHPLDINPTGTINENQNPSLVRNYEEALNLFMSALTNASAKLDSKKLGIESGKILVSMYEDEFGHK